MNPSHPRPRERNDDADNERHCCFCFELVDLTRTDEAVVLHVSKRERPGRQELYAHDSCLTQRLHARVPFWPELFA
jgi:hypothetical protein